MIYTRLFIYYRYNINNINIIYIISIINEEACVYH